MNPHEAMHVTPRGRSALLDLAASNEDAVELQMRSTLLRGLERWLASSDLTQIDAAKVLGITQVRVSDLKRGKISQFSGYAYPLGYASGSPSHVELVA